MNDTAELPRSTYMHLPAIQISDRQRKEFDEASIEELANDIEANGLIHPLVVNIVDAVPHLVAGERRWRAIKRLYQQSRRFTFAGMQVLSPYVPVVPHNDLTPIQEFEIELSENIKRIDLTWNERTAAIARLHELRTEEDGNHTYADTAEEFKEVEQNDTPVTTRNVLEVKEAEFLAGFADVPEVQKAKTKKEALKIAKKIMDVDLNAALDRAEVFGEDYEKPVETEEEQLDLPHIVPAPRRRKSRHKLYHADFRKALEVIRPGSIGVTVTDPPYGVGVADFGGAQQHTHNYSEDDTENLHRDMVEIISQLSEENAHAYVFCDFLFFDELREMFLEHEWRVRDKPLIWTKGGRGHLSDGGTLGFRSTYECIVFAQRGIRLCSSLKNDVLMIPPESNTIHAAQKPYILYQILLEQSGQIGDNVLDLFCGSGTIFTAAQKTEMTAYGFEDNDETIALCENARKVFREID